ncbi:accessory gland protein Acp53Ea [Drosophila biarmipes]|uniref:accessory gland protein Acp53Ea n=1 Tax=Drosophila biarmipes TaxID=125945 RepID=UPI0007E761F9|nr:accessory gland protein Acp53Ea [Drosophila biarmipes]
MKLIKYILAFSLCTLLFVDQTRAQNTKWDSWLKCNKVGTKALASLLRESVPAVRTLLNCLEFSPPPNIGTGYLSKMKLYYELLKRGAFERSKCLIVPLRESVKILGPYVKSLDTYNCLAD